MLDPEQYFAALFIGDTFFKQHQPGFAGEWFAHAVEINPDIEAAYRYWGDALSSGNQMGDARSKYIDAIVADPYNQTSWEGLKNWLGRELSNSDFGALAKIEKAGLLELFVLLNRADNGIAQDHAGYREGNREKIRRYLDEFVVPKAPSQPEAAKR